MAENQNTKLKLAQNGEVCTDNVKRLEIKVLELGEDADFLPDEDGEAQSRSAVPVPSKHKNIRGREYYRKDKQEL